jgi:hypothetical protein
LTFPQKQLHHDLESSGIIKKPGRLMKTRKYTEEQIIAVLREREAGAKVVNLYRKYGMSDATFNWKAKYAGLTINELKKLPLKNLIGYLREILVV